MPTIDACGKSCPMPIVLLAKAIRSIAVGEVLTVHADDRAFPEDVQAWCKKTGNALLDLRRAPPRFEADVRRDR